MLKPFYRTIRDLLSGRDWVYVLALLVPLTVYNLALKASSVAIKDGTGGFLSALSLMRSDILFALGYAAFWVGVFAIARSGLARVVALIFFHVISLLVVLVTTVAYQYFEGTGSTLDYSVITFYLSTLGEVKEIIASEASFLVWAALVAALLYVAFGSLLVTRLFFRRPSSGRVAGDSSRLGAVGLCVMAAGFGALAFVPGASDTNQSFSRSPFVNVVATSVSTPMSDGVGGEDASTREARSLSSVKLVLTENTQKKNVVFIHLESVRAESTTPYNPNLKTTPYLSELAKKSLLVERAYTTIPHTSKALTSLNCGIYPDPSTDIHESEPGGVPVECLPKLLGDEGYNSVVFQSAIGKFEDRPQLVNNFGYDKFIGLESLDKKGFERAGYLGYEDDILLKPSRNWLEENGKNKPFVASYVGITPHHEYLAPQRYGRKDLSNDDVMNHYLNAVRYDDFWVKNLIQQYKDLGLYENTIFVIYGDHGEAFGEHGVKGHDGVPYEEGLHVPLIIHEPGRWPTGKRTSADTPTDHVDIVPTLLDLMDYKTKNGQYPGTSILDAPRDRTLYFGCRPDLLCLASIRGYEKYIYNFGKQPDELYDLSKDPLEKNNLAPAMPTEELKKRRDDLLRWRSESIATFEKAPKTSK